MFQPLIFFSIFQYSLNGLKSFKLVTCVLIFFNLVSQLNVKID